MRNLISYNVSHIAIKIRFNVIALMLRSNLSFNRLIMPISALFYLLAGDVSERLYKPDGFSKFNIWFNSIYQEFLAISSAEEYSQFYDKFYKFLDNCFPKSLDE